MSAQDAALLEQVTPGNAGVVPGGSLSDPAGEFLRKLGIREGDIETEVSPLAAALWESGIAVFTRRSVSHYKWVIQSRSTAALSDLENRVRNLEMDVADSWWCVRFGVVVALMGGVAIGIVGGLVGTVLAGLLWCGTSLLHLPAIGSSLPEFMAGSLAMLWAAGILGFTGFIAFKGNPIRAWQMRRSMTREASTTVEVKWNVAPLESYKYPVPDEVRARAQEILSRLPDTQFAVHFTMPSRVLDLSAVRRDVEENYRPDPFLEARRGRESYFVAVWDEDGFVK